MITMDQLRLKKLKKMIYRIENTNAQRVTYLFHDDLHAVHMVTTVSETTPHCAAQK